jgi:twitching motility protein PilU
MEPTQASKFIHDLLRALGARKATELLLAAGRAPSMKMKGHDKHTPIAEQALSPVHIRGLTRAIMSEEQAAQFAATGTCEFAFSPAGLGNFQAIASEKQGDVSLVLRVLAAAPTKDSKGMLAG